ncbi:MAG: hypothetical protein NTW83_00370 [Cyanobacteria bacterium]|nr:hypothetical protein [Cyanobacteriota bacterium]
MGFSLRSSSLEAGESSERSIEEWSFLDQDVLRPSRSRKVCMTCHWFYCH